MHTILELLFHVSVACFYGYAEYVSVDVPSAANTYGGMLKFFTKWNLYLTITYNAASAVADLFSACAGNDKSARNESGGSRTLFFNGTVVPSTLVTVITYWGMHFRNPDLMASAAIRDLIPINGFQNHAVHTAPLITMLLESMCVFHRPGKLGSVLAVWVLYATTYLSWMLWVAYTANIWVYPFMRAMNTQGKAVFLAGVLVFGCVFVKMLNSFLHWYQQSENNIQKSKSNKKRI